MLPLKLGEISDFDALDIQVLTKPQEMFDEMVTMAEERARTKARTAVLALQVRLTRK